MAEKKFDPFAALARVQEMLSDHLLKESIRLSAIQRALIEKGFITAEDIDRHTKEIVAGDMVEAALDPEMWAWLQMVEKIRKCKEYLEQGLTFDEAMRRVKKEFGEDRREG